MIELIVIIVLLAVIVHLMRKHRANVDELEVKKREDRENWHRPASDWHKEP
jgi:predicted Holliday junction resolvase-like endonuclease